LNVLIFRVVINYDFPTGVEDYVHRIGRTGRAGATGIAYTFFCDQDWKYASDLVKLLEGANQQVPPQLSEMAARGVPPRGGLRDFPGGFAGRGGPGQGGFGGRSGGPGPGGFGGRGFGSGGPPGGYGGRGDFQGGRGGSRGGRGFRGGASSGRGRLERAPQDHYGSDGRGRYADRRRYVSVFVAYQIAVLFSGLEDKITPGSVFSGWCVSVP
jgi:ATP-dependent RNA helicase DDX5/DBP2